MGIDDLLAGASAGAVVGAMVGGGAAADPYTSYSSVLIEQDVYYRGGYIFDLDIESMHHSKLAVVNTGVIWRKLDKPQRFFIARADIVGARQNRRDLLIDFRYNGETKAVTFRMVAMRAGHAADKVVGAIKVMLTEAGRAESESGVPPSPPLTTETRLRDLRRLHDERLITDEEYAAKRALVISEL